MHILVRNRKIGTLLQLLKVLTIDKIDFVENKYLTKISSNESELTLRQLLNKLMSEQDDDAVDPYQLSLIMK